MQPSQGESPEIEIDGAPGTGEVVASGDDDSSAGSSPISLPVQTATSDLQEETIDGAPGTGETIAQSGGDGGSGFANVLNQALDCSIGDQAEDVVTPAVDDSADVVVELTDAAEPPLLIIDDDDSALDDLFKDLPGEQNASASDTAVDLADEVVVLDDLAEPILLPPKPINKVQILQECFREIRENCLTALDAEGLLAQTFSPKDYINNNFIAQDVEKFIYNEALQEVFTTQDFSRARTIAAFFKINQEVFIECLEMAHRDALKWGKDACCLRAEFLDLDRLLAHNEAKVAGYALEGVRHLMQPKKNSPSGRIEAAVKLAEDYQLSPKQTGPVFASACWRVIKAGNYLSAKRMIELAALTRADLAKEHTNNTISYKDEFLNKLEASLGKRGSLPEGYRDALFEIAAVLKISKWSLNGSVNRAFLARLNDGSASGALSIAEQFELKESKVRQSAKTAVPYLLKNNLITAAVDITVEFDFAAEVTAPRSFSVSAKEACLNVLKHGHWYSELPLMNDCGLLPDSVRKDPEVRAAVFEELFDVLGSKNPSALQVTMLLSLFEIDRPSLVEKVMDRVDLFCAKGKVAASEYLLRTYGITAATKGAERLRSSFELAATYHLCRMNYGTASQICKKHGVSREQIAKQETPLRIATHCLNKGDLLNAVKIVSWLGLDQGTLAKRLTKPDLKLAYQTLIPRGWSDSLERLIDASTLNKAKLYRHTTEKAVYQCLAADIRSAKWSKLAAAKAAFGVSEEVVIQIAKDQIEDILAMGDPRKAQDILTHFAFDQRDFMLAGVSAAMRAYDIADTDRIDQIAEVIPSIKTSADNPTTRVQLSKTYIKQLHFGWRPRIWKHFEETFNFNHTNLNSPKAAALCGVEAELNRGDIASAVKLAEYVNIPASLLGEAILQLESDKIAEHAGKFADLAKVLLKKYGNLTEALGPGGELRVKDDIFRRLKSGDCKSPDIIGSCFGISQDQIDDLALQAVRELLIEKDTYAAETLVFKFALPRDGMINITFSNPEEFRKQLKLPPEKQTLQEAIAFVQNTNSKVKWQNQPNTGRWFQDFTNVVTGKKTPAAAKSTDGKLSVNCIYPVRNLRQKTHFTCGAASARMALMMATSIPYGEEQVVEWLGTNEELGTPIANYTRLNTSFPELEVLVSANGTHDQLRSLLREGYVIIVNFRNGTEPHYAVLRGLNGKDIYLSDPISGPDLSFLLKDFNWSGGYDEGRVERAFVAIRPRGDIDPEKFPAAVADVNY